MSGRTRFWHGGHPGLRPGDTIRAAATLPTLPLVYTFGADYPTDPNCVYVTTDKTLARSYAAKAIHAGGVGGDLYNVRPRGPLEHDPDYLPEVPCFTCSTAVITGVVERGITMTTALEIYANRHTYWDDGTPMYTRDGFALPSLPMRELGLVDKDFEVLGPAASFDTIDSHARQLLASRRVPLPSLVPKPAEARTTE